jgi:DNA polymerase/3'-5' exonuclease PolX
MSNIQPHNQKLVSEFEKLVNFVQIEIDTAKIKKDVKLITANTFRLKQIANALITIKKFQKNITLDNIDEFAQLPGIGKGTVERIKEIIDKGKLEEIANFKDTVDENKKLIEELESIIGVGRSHALDLISQGIKSVADLKKKIDKGKIEVNDKIALGVKYYGKFAGDIPRAEIDKVYKIFESIIKKMNSHYKLSDENKYIFEICGSYRRERPTSGDIDVLVSKLGTKLDEPDEINHLARFVDRLKKPIKSNDSKPLLVDDMTDKNFTTKYMGFAQYKSNPFRRIDIRFIPHDAYYPALLYFTGSADLNVKMRKIAKTMKLKLSEYGLAKEDGTRLPISTEHDFFKILKIEYLEPKFR